MLTVRIKDSEINDINDLYFSSFISLIIDKDPKIFKERKEFINEGNEKHVINKLIEHHNTKKNCNNSNDLNDLSWHNEKKTFMIEDINYGIKVVCITLLKYVLSAIYPYIFNEKTMQKYFKVFFLLSRKV